MKQRGNMGQHRFAFGKNWQRYLRGVGAEELDAAKYSLASALNGFEPRDLTFLDIGSGSGLFSRAAYELGFGRVVSFDYDVDSVAATDSLRQAAGADGERWQVMQGSVLDEAFMASLGRFDFVYSWGVLHHTGAMWQAVDRAAEAVKLGGRLFIALYNDQGWISRYWLYVKKTYAVAPAFARFLLLLIFWTYFGAGLFVADVARGRNPLRRHRGDARGMKFFTDVIDWVGGFPFEVAKPAVVVSRLGAQGFAPIWTRLVGRRHGCNEFLFCRDADRG